MGEDGGGAGGRAGAREGSGRQACRPSGSGPARDTHRSKPVDGGGAEGRRGGGRRETGTRCRRARIGGWDGRGAWGRVLCVWGRSWIRVGAWSCDGACGCGCTEVCARNAHASRHARALRGCARECACLFVGWLGGGGLLACACVRVSASACVRACVCACMCALVRVCGRAFVRLLVLCIRACVLIFVCVGEDRCVGV